MPKYKELSMGSTSVAGSRKNGVAWEGSIKKEMFKPGIKGGMHHEGIRGRGIGCRRHRDFKVDLCLLCAERQRGGGERCPRPGKAKATAVGRTALRGPYGKLGSSCGRNKHPCRDSEKRSELACRIVTRLPWLLRRWWWENRSPCSRPGYCRHEDVLDRGHSEWLEWDVLQTQIERE